MFKDLNRPLWFLLNQWHLFFFGGGMSLCCVHTHTLIVMYHKCFSFSLLLAAFWRSLSKLGWCCFSLFRSFFFWTHVYAAVLLFSFLHTHTHTQRDTQIFCCFFIWSCVAYIIIAERWCFSRWPRHGTWWSIGYTPLMYCREFIRIKYT